MLELLASHPIETYLLNTGRVGGKDGDERSKKVKIPHSSALLQQSLGLPNDAGCFDINLGCSGYVYALSVVKGLMRSEGITDALLVTCDPYSRIMGRTDRDTIALFGDAATASWLSAKKGAEIGRLDWGTDGAGAEHLMVPRGGSAKPLSYVDGETPEVADAAELRLHMNGRGIFNFMIQRLPGTLKACLEKNALRDEVVDFYVLHQASRFMLQTLATRLRIPAEKLPMNLERVGNTVSSSIPLLLAELSERGALRGKTVLVSGFGVGLSWASNILKFEG